MVRRFRLLLLASTMLAAASVGVSADPIKSVAIVTPEQGTDFGWNQQGIEGARAAATEKKLEFVAAQGMGYGDIRPTLRELAEDGAGLIIAHAGGYATEAGEIATEAKVHIAFNNKGVSIAPYAADYTLSGENGAYLAGVLAAKMTKTGIVGVVVSSESATWNSQSAGFVQGVRATSPSVKVRYAVIGPKAYSDVAGARRVTESVIASDADIIFGQGNGSSFGMIQAIETVKPPSGNKVWFIDVIGDKSSIDKNGVLLSSVVWDFSPVFVKMIDDVVANKFGSQVYSLSLADNSLKLLKSKGIPDNVWAHIMAEREKLISGAVKVERIHDAQKVRAMMSSTSIAAQ